MICSKCGKDLLDCPEYETGDPSSIVETEMFCVDCQAEWEAGCVAIADAYYANLDHILNSITCP